MDSYLTINWWAGNLPPYESIMSFLTRFCVLNRITIEQATQYLGVSLGRGSTNDDVERVANILKEDISTVRTVLMPSLTFENFGQYRLPKEKTSELSIKYCEKCAVLGYHSSLHEVECLQKCPFHMTDLQKSYTDSPIGNSRAKQQIKAMQRIMCQHSKLWPSIDGSACAIDYAGQFKQLSEWVMTVSNAAIQLSQRQIWYFGEDDFSRDDISLKQAIGRLRTITPIPETLVPLFIEIGELWNLDTRKFPLKIKTALANLQPDVPFKYLLNFYKRISGYSSHPPRFIMRCRKAQATIKVRHGGKCGCCWGGMNLGWRDHWIQVDPMGWPHWTLICPYDAAIRELELGWGCANLVLSSRTAEKETLRFIKLSRFMHDAGVIDYTPGAQTSKEGYLYVFPQVWPCCEWNNKSPLTCLLNAVVELEFELIYGELKEWLRKLDEGQGPYTRRNLTGCVRLCETPEGLLLVSWGRAPT